MTWMLVQALASIAMAVTMPGAAPPTPCTLVDTAPTDAVVSLPFRIVDGRIYVEVRVNGAGPFRFAVDTGASGMGRADASLAAQLKLPVTGATTTSDAVATAQVDTVRLASVELGGLVRRDLDVMTRDYAGKMAPEAAFAGILGREFFADGLLVIDYPRQRLTFTRGKGLTQGAPGVLAYSRAFRVPVTIGGLATEGNLDTGANVAFVLPRTLFDRVGGGTLEQAREGTLTNTVVTTANATLHGPFRIGGASLSDVEVRVSERYPELLVGAHALQHFALLIDQRSSSIALCPAPAR
ncbi:aspartyl protease family protein [Sphingomonas sp. HITSZ_GF]|uniref:aspartyl protease family protein n=1 Tax=Sphingomonas sp. HITSZ_GF TaxID=3037247 RepID=UPI00240E49EC|nr:aspartyl protease family protein [Sphingomonas sp. HITSZ_GF]MDG2534752.1 aspartyl protease family protein [Sphingomonas sp. HITSZ_GF]